MPKTSAKTRKAAKRTTLVAKPKTNGTRRSKRNGTARKRKADPTNGTRPHAYVIEEGRPAYVLVPIAEYEELVKADMAQAALAQIRDQDNEFVDADELRLQLAGERIVRARKATGLTQKALGKKLNLPQSQISRIERHPDHTTIRTLKRIARALDVNIRALV